MDREFARLQSKELLNHLSEVLEFIDVIEISKYENFIEIRLKHCTQEIVAGLSIYESFFRKGQIDFLLCIASDQDFDQDLFNGVKNISKQKDAEELFDRIGVRFITQNKVDVLRVIKFLTQNYVVMANNNKPSRAQNSLIDLEKFKESYRILIKENLKKPLSEEEFAKKAEEILEHCDVIDLTDRENKHSSRKYKAIHFTCRQLIHYRNPFFKDFLDLRNLAKDSELENPLAKKILSMNPEAIARDIRFFYPYEVQITDIESHSQNTAGEASHKEYKRSQLISAMHRIFRPLIEYKTQLEIN